MSQHGTKTHKPMWSMTTRGRREDEEQKIHATVWMTLKLILRDHLLNSIWKLLDHIEYLSLITSLFEPYGYYGFSRECMTKHSLKRMPQTPCALRRIRVFYIFSSSWAQTVRCPAPPDQHESTWYKNTHTYVENCGKINMRRARVANACDFVMNDNGAYSKGSPSQ